MYNAYFSNSLIKFAISLLPLPFSLIIFPIYQLRCQSSPVMIVECCEGSEKMSSRRGERFSRAENWHRGDIHMMERERERRTSRHIAESMILLGESQQMIAE